ncbi:MAG: glycosyltransferase family 4 protein [Calditrichaeota bacterium]|nr:MAG: glycosyltransferase family 4 protein [Calditrichota bacterium]
MKILFLTEHFPSPDSPDSSPVSFFASQKLSTKHKVTVIHANFQVGLTKPEIKVEVYNENYEVVRLGIALPPKGDRLWLRCILLRIALNFVQDKLDYLKDCDLIFARLATTPGWAGVQFGKKHKIPTVIWAVGSDIHTYPQIPILKHFNKYALKNAKGIVCNSNFLAEETEKLGINKSKIIVANTGIADTLFVPKNKMDCRKHLNLPLDKNIVVFAGHLIPIKGIDILLESWKEFVAKNPNSLLTLCGSGEGINSYRKFTKDNGFSKSVIFRAAIAHKDVADWFGASDVVVLPSRNEGFPAVLMEAQSCGRPVVATKVGGIPEIVNSDDLGILVSPENSNELTEALEKVFNTNWNRDKIVAASKRFSWNKFGENIDDFIKNIV